MPEKRRNAMTNSNRKIISAVSCLLALALTFTVGIRLLSPDASAERADYSQVFVSDGYYHEDKMSGYDKTFIIDVSSYNTVTDWNKVYEAGIEGVMLRVGYRGYKTAAFNQDTSFETFYAGAKAAGLKVGAYFYGQPVSVDDSTAEANYTLGLLAGKTFELPVAYDVEYASKNGSFTGRLYEARLSSITLTAICNNFCSKIEAAGYDTMLYVNVSLLSSHLLQSFISYPIWLARYNSYVDYSCNYELWQYTSKGTVDGISGNVDVSVRYTEPAAPETTDPEAENPDETGEDATDEQDTTVTQTEPETRPEPVSEDSASTGDASQGDSSSMASFFTMLLQLFEKFMQFLPKLISMISA